MAKCEFLEECSFFSHEVGYSPTLYEEMKARFCFADWQSCARLEAAEKLPPGTVPKDLIPTDHARVQRLVELVAAGQYPDHSTETTPRL